MTNVPDYLTNPGRPFFLHPNGNPSLVLVNPPLSGKNYHTWARAMSMALLSKNKLGFVDGTITRPAIHDPLYVAWQRCNTIVLAWIHISINGSIEKSILWMNRASDVWTDMKNRFSQSDIFKLYEIQEDLYKLRQGEMSVTDYFTELKTLWDELDNLRVRNVAFILKS